jgi:hypothetical protein
MIGVLHELEQRRMAVQKRSSMKRLLVAQSCMAIAARGAILDRAYAVARSTGAWPLVLGCLGAVALIVGPRKVLGWAARAAALYGVTRRIGVVVRGGLS